MTIKRLHTWASLFKETNCDLIFRFSTCMAVYKNLQEFSTLITVVPLLLYPSCFSFLEQWRLQRSNSATVVYSMLRSVVHKCWFSWKRKKPILHWRQRWHKMESWRDTTSRGFNCIHFGTGRTELPCLRHISLHEKSHRNLHSWWKLIMDVLKFVWVMQFLISCLHTIHITLDCFSKPQAIRPDLVVFLSFLNPLQTCHRVALPFNASFVQDLLDKIDDLPRPIIQNLEQEEQTTQSVQRAYELRRSM